jgi:hypothetical protein
LFAPPTQGRHGPSCFFGFRQACQRPRAARVRGCGAEGWGPARFMAADRRFAVPWWPPHVPDLRISLRDAEPGASEPRQRRQRLHVAERAPPGRLGRGVLRGPGAARDQGRLRGLRRPAVQVCLGDRHLRDRARAPSPSHPGRAFDHQHPPVSVRPLGVRPQRQHRGLRRDPRRAAGQDPPGAAPLHPRHHRQRGPFLSDPRQDVAAVRAAPTGARRSPRSPRCPGRCARTTPARRTSPT